MTRVVLLSAALAAWLSQSAALFLAIAKPDACRGQWYVVRIVMTSIS